MLRVPQLAASISYRPCVFKTWCATHLRKTIASSFSIPHSKRDLFSRRVPRSSWTPEGGPPQICVGPNTPFAKEKTLSLAGRWGTNWYISAPSFRRGSFLKNRLRMMPFNRHRVLFLVNIFNFCWSRPISRASSQSIKAHETSVWHRWSTRWHASIYLFHRA